MQLLLLYYANWYKQIFEMSPDERPADDVINDDDELDRWYKNYTRRVERELREAKRRSRGQQSSGNWVSTDDLFKGD